MGKVMCDDSATDTSDDERRKTIREEKKVHRKKKKRKRNLTDPHQRLFKSKKGRRSTSKSWRSNFVKLLQHFADIRQKYDKESKIRRELGTARNSKRASNRILPRPVNCAGIYRNGSTGKEIRRSQMQLPLNDSSNARLEGNVLKLLHGYDSKSEPIVIANNIKGVPKDLLLHSTIENIQQPTSPDVQCISPAFNNVDGIERLQTDEESILINVPHKFRNRKKLINSENYFNIPLSKYEELCKAISVENFQGSNFPTEFMPDPLIAIKKKLRSSYAASFRNQFLRVMIRRKTILNEFESPSTSVGNQFPSEIECDFSNTITIENPERHLPFKKDIKNNLQESQNSFLIPELNFNFNRARKAKVSSSNLLFDLSIFNSSNTVLKNMENKGNKNDSIDKNIQTFLEVNDSSTSAWNSSDMKYFETHAKRVSQKNKSALFVQMGDGSQNNFINKKNVIRRRNQRTQLTNVLSSGLKRNIGRQSLKIPQQVKTKNLKHIPAILRRCNNPGVNSNSRLNLFQESMHMDKQSSEMLFDTASEQNILFSPESLRAELNQNARRLQTSKSVNTTFDGNKKDVQACVIESPNLQNDSTYFMKNPCLQTMEKKNQAQTLHIKDNFVKKNHPVQKTVMFTKKDSRNIGHCLHLNGLISDGTVNDSNVCIIKKNVPVQQEKSANDTYTLHRNCCRTFPCSQDIEYSNYERQEFKESAPIVERQCVHQEPVLCEKVLMRNVQQHSKYETNQKCHNDQHLCYVVVDQCKDANNFQECSNNIVPRMKKLESLQNRHCCQKDVADVGILQGVQNLKILPMQEQETIKFANNRCVENAVVFEEQPIKYLAFERDSKTEKIPIYMQKNKHVSIANNANVTNPNVNYCMVSCPQESAQKIILVPTCEQNNVVYVRQHNLDHSHAPFEGCSHSSKVVLYQPEVQCVENNSTMCNVHVPKQKIIRKNECEVVLNNIQQADNIKKSGRNEDNCKKLYYRPRHEHSLLNDTCAGSQVIVYEK